MKNKKRNLDVEPRLSERADDRDFELENEVDDPTAVLSFEEDDDVSEDVTVSIDDILFASKLPGDYDYCFVPGPCILQ